MTVVGYLFSNNYKLWCIHSHAVRFCRIVVHVHSIVTSACLLDLCYNYSNYSRFVDYDHRLIQVQFEAFSG